MRGHVIKLSAAMLLTGCMSMRQPAPPAQTKVVDTACAWARPIYVSKADVLTDGTARQILAHNEAGAKACNWHRQ